MTETEAVLRSVLRAEELPEVLATVGFSIQGETPQLRIEYPSVSTIGTFRLSELATGLIKAWTRGTDLDRWASVVVMVDWIDVDDLDSPDGQVLLNAVWKAAGGGEVDDQTLDTARRIAGA